MGILSRFTKSVEYPRTGTSSPPFLFGFSELSRLGPWKHEGSAKNQVQGGKAETA